MHPAQLTIDRPDHRLCVFEWGEASEQATTLVFNHATGFHARCWDETIRSLLRLHPDLHILALDQRGHGRSDASPFDNWRAFAEDLIAVMDALSVSTALGVGHSMGAHAMLFAQSLRADLFERLVLVDPVIFSPEFYQHENQFDMKSAFEHPTARRRAQFDSVEAMIERFHGREPFSLFTEQALRDYCEYGVTPSDDGKSVQLLCDPAFEAGIYTTALSNGAIIDAAAQVDVPVDVIRAMQARRDEDMVDFKFSPTWPGLADHLPNGRDVLMAELTHFIPMQAPEWMAAHIAAQIGVDETA